MTKESIKIFNGSHLNGRDSCLVGPYECYVAHFSQHQFYLERGAGQKCSVQGSVAVKIGGQGSSRILLQKSTHNIALHIAIAGGMQRCHFSAVNFLQCLCTNALNKCYCRTRE